MNWTRLATAFLFVAAVPALAQVPVRILKPAPEQTVRGSVPIVINASAIPSDGYMQVEINDEFMAAVAPVPGTQTLTYVWDTKSDFAGTGAPPRDGQYTIRVKSYNSRFQFQRSNELNVYLRNHISIPANKSITLKYRFRPDEQFSFVERVSAKSAGQDVYSANVPVTLDINDVVDGLAEAREKISRSAMERVTGNAQPMAVAGRSFMVRVAPNGTVLPGPRMKKAGYSPATSMLVLPSHPVKIGDTWTSQITLTPYYNGVLSATISGTNKLTGLEYFGQHPSARIESTYDGTATVAISGTPTPVTFRGKRVTYFDYVRGRLLREEDTVNASFGSAAAANPYGAGGTTDTSSVNLTIVTAAR